MIVAEIAPPPVFKLRRLLGGPFRILIQLMDRDRPSCYPLSWWRSSFVRQLQALVVHATLHLLADVRVVLDCPAIMHHIPARAHREGVHVGNDEVPHARRPRHHPQRHHRRRRAVHT